MKKTVDITIEGKRFHIEEEAFERLRSYLDQLKSHFSKQEDGDEIVADIEVAIGGHLEQLSTQHEVVNLSHVEDLIQRMGTVDDLVDTVGEYDLSEAVGVTDRRLFRNTDDQVIGGVCSGIASYIGVNALVVRLLFLLLVLFWGTGVILYFVLWLILPEAKTVHEKILMRGEPITVAKIESVARTAFSNTPSVTQAGSRLHRVFLLPFHIIGSVFRELMNFLMRAGAYVPEVTGVLVTAGSIIGIYAAMIAAAVLLFRMDRFEFDPQTAELLTHLDTRLLIALLGVVVVVPLILGIIFGVSIYQRKNRFRAIPLFGLITIWMIAVGWLGVMTIDFAPHVKALREEETRDYPMDERSFVFQEFDVLTINVPARLHVLQGDAWDVKMKGDERALQEVVFLQEASVLALNWTPEALKCVWFCRQRVVDVYITMPDLQKLSLNGRISADVDTYSGDTIIVELDRMSSINFKSLTVDHMDLTMNANSQIVLRGSATDMNINASGNATIHALEFQTSHVALFARNSVRLELHATHSVMGEMRNYTTLIHRGDPNLTGLTIKDMAKVTREFEESPPSTETPLVDE